MFSKLIEILTDLYQPAIIDLEDAANGAVMFCIDTSKPEGEHLVKKFHRNRKALSITGCEGVRNETDEDYLDYQHIVCYWVSPR